MAIYTKKGDKGETSMFSSDPEVKIRISKANFRVQAIGAIDETNSYLGVANSFCKTKSTNLFIKTIQRDLFQIGSILAKSPLRLEKGRTKVLENKIDQLTEKLPPLRNFVMPEGSICAVHFMYARALARRAERRVVALHKKEKVPEVILQYLNRLSDLLFTIFRSENAKAKVSENLWIGRKPQP